MDIEIKLEKGRDTPKLVLLTGEMTPELEELLRRVEGEISVSIPGWQDERMFPLEQSDILRCYAAEQRVYAQTAQGEYLLRLRLYELEEKLDRRRFARISHSEIVNLKQVTAIDLSLTGTICMTLTGGTKVFVSRRYVKIIKQTLDL